MMSLLRKAARALISALSDVGGAVWEVNPFIAPRDLLNRWGTYRLRRHPLHVLIRILGMGALVWIIYQAGHRWIQPKLVSTVQGISAGPMLKEILLRTATALFSSLNIISCLSVAAIWADLRHMARDGHLESLQVVPGRLSAPALYYGIATRYLPLALVALLFFFLDVKTSPFEREPFKDTTGSFAIDAIPTTDPPYQDLSAIDKLLALNLTIPVWDKLILDPWTIYWPFITIAAMLLFCIVNFFMDTVIGYWTFTRFRVSIASLAVAIMIVGGLTPVFFMTVNAVIQRRFSPILNTTPQSLDYILDTYYFLFSSAASLIIAIGLLTLTALQWRRLQSSATADPVLLRVHH